MEGGGGEVAVGREGGYSWSKGWIILKGILVKLILVHTVLVMLVNNNIRSLGLQK